MDYAASVYVSHHQMLIGTGEAPNDLGIYAAYDDLLHLCGESALTVFTGVHSAEVDVRVRVGDAAPGDRLAGWTVAGEATLWCSDGRMAVYGLMGDCPPDLQDIAVPGPGLVRVQVRGRKLSPVEDPEEGAPAEEYEVRVWPVAEDIGPCTLYPAGDAPEPWPPAHPRVAAWAMVQLVTAANPDAELRNLRSRVPAPPPPPRVDVLRSRWGQAELLGELLADPRRLLGATTDGGAGPADGDDLLVPAGGLAIRLHPLAAGAGARRFRWTWETAARSAFPEPMTGLPDDEPSEVELRVDADASELVVRHRGVRGPDAVLLGLLWDHLLDRVEDLGDGEMVLPLPWEATFETMAAAVREEAERVRRHRQEYEDRRWGGRTPSERVQRLPANSYGLARLDRPLLDALERADPATQRAVARWAADTGARLAGLSDIDWIAPALAALAAGTPLPPPFDDLLAAFDRLLTDPRVPQTLITLPDIGSPNALQQAMVLPAIPAAAHPDPLAGAVEAVYATTIAHGDDHPRFLAALRAAFPALA